MNRQNYNQHYIYTCNDYCEAILCRLLQQTAIILVNLFFTGEVVVRGEKGDRGLRVSLFYLTIILKLIIWCITSARILQQC